MLCSHIDFNGRYTEEVEMSISYHLNEHFSHNSSLIDKLRSGVSTLLYSDI